jgi:hypothetical protein
MDLVKVHWGSAAAQDVIQKFQKALDEAAPHKYQQPSAHKQPEET